jgi:Flp pilus assembly protein CpaB
MKNRWQKLSGWRPEQEGPLSATLPADDLDGPRVRLRPETDGATPRSPRRRSWTQPIPVAGALLVLLALLGYWSVYSQTTKRSQVLVARHALEAGAAVRTSDLATAGLAGSGGVLASFVPARERGLIVGRVLSSPVAAGAPIPRAAVAPANRRAASFTLAVPVLHALGGELAPGDRVTVLATFTSSSGQATTRVVARALPVTSVGRAAGFDAGAQTIPVTVALPDPSLATALALANEAGKLDLLREGGSGRTAPIPPATAPGGLP